jgi:hypothetical protein
MDVMFCVTPGVGVSMYMWVTTIWQNSMGHKQA